MTERRFFRIPALAVAGFVLAGTSASAQVRYGTSEQPLEGQRYDTMRALAHYLDETAQDALQGATQDARYGTAAQRRVVTTVRAFARQAQQFHETMDAYESQPSDVVDDVNFLIARARRVSDRLRTTRAFGSTNSDWRNVTEVLDRMRRLLAGEDVEVPPAHGELSDVERDYGPFRDVYSGGTRGLTGASLQEFRQLAHDLDASVYRAWYLSQQRGGNAAVDLERFSSQVSDLHQRADARVVDPAELAPIVGRLLEEARTTEGNIRQVGVLRDVSYEWSRAVGMLSRMNDLLVQR